jgi:AcrR family transcriptional regulator
MPTPFAKTPVIELTWVKPPMQQRSQETLERLLTAAEEIILESGVEAASVAAVTKRARSSVGSFYTRFPDRESLLRAVCLRFGQEARATMDAVISPERWQGHSLAHVLESCIGFLFRVVQERRALLVSLLAGTSRDLELSQLMSGLVQHLATRLHALLLARDEVRQHAQPELTAQMIAGMLLASAQGRALMHLQDPPRVSDAELTRELGQMCLAYLGAGKAPDDTMKTAPKRARVRHQVARIGRRP